jgi:hypothetical protein
VSTPSTEEKVLSDRHLPVSLLISSLDCDTVIGFGMKIKRPNSQEVLTILPFFIFLSQKEADVMKFCSIYRSIGRDPKNDIGCFVVWQCSHRQNTATSSPTGLFSVIFL